MKILIAEDSKLERKHLKDYLRKIEGLNIFEATNGSEALEIYEREKDIDLVLLDWIMPIKDGYDVCKTIRKKEKNSKKYTYIIMLTAKSSKEDIIKGFEIGVDDYITKPFDEDELIVRIKVGKRILEMYKKIKELNEKLHFEATHDDLTRIYNRRKIYELLELELKSKKDIFLAILDIDYFKHVNDTYGHLAGNFVLKKFSDLIKKLVKSYGHVGRVGGEEFMIFLPNFDANKGVKLLEIIRESVETTKFNFEGKIIKITVSIGATMNKENESLDRFISRADDNLYEAKKLGRNRIVYK